MLLNKKNMKFFALIIGLSSFNQALGVHHTLQYLYTVSSGVSNLPSFFSSVVIDGVPISFYDSNKQRKVPLQEWMEGKFDQQYWNRRSAIEMDNEQVFKANIQKAKSQFNQTGGIHIFQQMSGCTWDDKTEVKEAFEQIGYDGEDFFFLDLRNMAYIAAMKHPQLTVIQHYITAKLEFDKVFFTTECVSWLNRYLFHGCNTLGKKVPPEVSLFQKGSSSSDVVCHATGFYPEGVMITWKRNGVEIQDDVDVRETLPNHDGTFQKRVTLTVPLEERRKSNYTCEVAHNSGTIFMILNEDEIKHSVPDSSPRGPIIGPIIGVVIGLLVLIAVIAGFVALRYKKKSGPSFTRADTDASTAALTAEDKLGKKLGFFSWLNL